MYEYNYQPASTEAPSFLDINEQEPVEPSPKAAEATEAPESEYFEVDELLSQEEEENYQIWLNLLQKSKDQELAR